MTLADRRVEFRPARVDEIGRFRCWRCGAVARVSDGCRANGAAGWIAVDAAFPSGDQRPLRHPGCRCALLSRVAP